MFLCVTYCDRKVYPENLTAEISTSVKLIVNYLVYVDILVIQFNKEIVAIYFVGFGYTFTVNLSQ